MNYVKKKKKYLWSIYYGIIYIVISKAILLNRINWKIERIYIYLIMI